MCQAPVSRPAGNLNLIFADVNTTPFPLMDVWPRAVVLVLNVVESQTLFPAPSSLPNFRVALKSPSESAGKGVFFLDKNLSWMSHKGYLPKRPRSFFLMRSEMVGFGGSGGGSAATFNAAGW